MKQQVFIYRVNEDDSLEGIASKLNLTIFDLRRFHNSVCDYKNLLPKDNLPTRIKEIYYKKKVDEVPIFILNNEYANRHVICPYIPERDLLEYNVFIEIENGKNKHNVKYKVDLNYLSNKLVEITKTNFYIDYQEPDLMFDELALKVASCLYPLVLEITDSGSISEIKNYDDILNRWNILKEELNKEYIGDTFEKYITVNEQIYNQEHAILKSIEEDWFLTCFFYNNYGEYIIENNYSGIFYFKSIPFLDSIKYSVDKFLGKDSYNDRYILHIEGVVDDYRSKQQLIERIKSFIPPTNVDIDVQNKIKGNIRAKYFFNSFHIIENIYLESNIELEYNYKLYISINQIKNRNYE